MGNRRSQPDLTDAAELIVCFDQFAGESDRAVVVLAAAMLEFLLEEVRRKSLLPSLRRKEDLLFDSRGAIANFSAKIELSYRAGLIDAEFATALHALRKLRNDFAHDLSPANPTEARYKAIVKSIVEPLRSDSSFLSPPAFLVGQHTGTRRDLRVAFSVMVLRLRFLSKKTEVLRPKITLPLNLGK